MEVLFFLIVSQLLCGGYQTFMDMAWISVGYGSDIEGGGDSLVAYKAFISTFDFGIMQNCTEMLSHVNHIILIKQPTAVFTITIL